MNISKGKEAGAKILIFELLFKGEDSASLLKNGILNIH